MNEPFEKTIQKTLAELPDDLRSALARVQVLVQQEPSREQLLESGLNENDELFGLFEGLSLLERPVGEEGFFPDRVILFEGPLRRYCPGKKELEQEIRKTLLHELGHFFGFDEEELKSRGLE